MLRPRTKMMKLILSFKEKQGYKDEKRPAGIFPPFSRPMFLVWANKKQGRM